MSKHIKLANHDEATIVDDRFYDYLSQFKWHYHKPSGGRVVAYLNMPPATTSTRMVFMEHVILYLDGRLRAIPLRDTSATTNKIGKWFIVKEVFERYARRPKKEVS